MDENKSNSAGEDRGYNREHAEAAFCEKLLTCCACAKIYFSKQPIELPTLSRRDFYVCLACSRKLRCSLCDEPVTTETTLVVENIPEHPIGFLCPHCRERILRSFRPSPRSIPKRLWLAFISAAGAFFDSLRRLMRVELLPRKKRR